MKKKRKRSTELGSTSHLVAQSAEHLEYKRRHIITYNQNPLYYSLKKRIIFFFFFVLLTKKLISSPVPNPENIFLLLFLFLFPRYLSSFLSFLPRRSPLLAHSLSLPPPLLTTHELPYRNAGQEAPGTQAGAGTGKK